LFWWITWWWWTNLVSETTNLPVPKHCMTKHVSDSDSGDPLVCNRHEILQVYDRSRYFLCIYLPILFYKDISRNTSICFTWPYWTRLKSCGHILYVSSQHVYQNSCPKGKCGCQYFILLTLKKKKIPGHRVLDFS
jgi:hypothetical protein